MILNVLLFDVGGVGIFIGLAILFIGLAVAVIVYKMLKKSVKMAFRMALVAAILIAALMGTVAFFVFGGSESGDKRKNTPTTTPKAR